MSDEPNQLSLIDEISNPPTGARELVTTRKLTAESVDLLLSIRPEHADRIFVGSKHFELRKVLPARPIRRVFLYVSGTNGVVGGFDAHKVIHERIDKLWRMVGTRATSEERFFAYFAKSPKGYAIEIANPVRFERSLDIKELREHLPGLMAPMSYLALRPDDPIARELEGAYDAAVGQLAPTVSLRSIRPAERAEYKRLVAKHIGPNYDEIDDAFATRTLDVHDLGRDPLGFFTTVKKVFGIEDTRGKLVGFTTLTLKSGGSLKSGPTILLEKFRNRGFGRATRRAIETYATEQGARKVYCTAPATGFSTIRYLLAADMKVEAHLTRQYTTRHDELVFGKFVVTDQIVKQPPLSLRPTPASVRSLADMPRSEAVASYRRMFAEFFHDMPTKRAQEILARAKPLLTQSAATLATKPREHLCLVARKKCRAFLTLIPKRGGAMKAVLIRDTDHKPSIEQLIEAGLRLASEVKERKIYFLHPLRDVVLVCLLIEKDFRCEGVLRAPYRQGDDIIVLARFL